MMIELNKIYCMDALEMLKAMAPGMVDLFVTSPPYNFRNSTGGFWNGDDKSSLWANGDFRSGYATHTDDMPHEDYIKWQRAILDEMLRILPDDGAIFYNHKWRIQGGNLQNLPGAITEGLPVRQIIIWDRGSGFNFNSGYFLPSYEVIYLIAKPNFNLVDKANALRDVWLITPSANKPHPNSFPFELPHRCIRSTSAKVVCDPFCGIGTTLQASHSLGRAYIGCDIAQEYVDIANRYFEPLPLFAQESR